MGSKFLILVLLGALVCATTSAASKLMSQEGFFQDEKTFFGHPGFGGGLGGGRGGGFGGGGLGGGGGGAGFGGGAGLGVGGPGGGGAVAVEDLVVGVD